MFKEELPDVWWITPDIKSVTEVTSLITLFEERITQNIRHIQFRQTLLTSTDYSQTYKKIAAYANQHEICLIINNDPTEAQALGSSGCYLNSTLLMQYRQRPLSQDYLVGAYCHDLTELKHAEKLGLDFVSLSPVKPTKTHPEATPLGWSNFKKLAAQISIPVYALGGLNVADLMDAKDNGACGIMGIRFA